MATNRQERLRLYDIHNPHCRFSDDINLRLFGKCGCKQCGEIRKEWANDPAPINDQTRKGHAMSSVNLCDRCGAMVTGVALGNMQLRTSADYDTSETVSKELCPGCVETLLGFVEQEVTPQRKAYRKPYQRPQEEDTTVKDIIRQVVEEVHNAKAAIEAPPVTKEYPRGVY